MVVTVTTPLFEINALSQLCPLVETFDIAIGEPLLVMLTVCDVEVDPSEVLIVRGFGLATRPELPPLPTVRLTVIARLPFGVDTVTVPESLPFPNVRFVGVTVISTLVP